MIRPDSIYNNPSTIFDCRTRQRSHLIRGYLQTQPRTLSVMVSSSVNVARCRASSCVRWSHSTSACPGAFALTISLHHAEPHLSEDTVRSASLLLLCRHIPHSCRDANLCDTCERTSGCCHCDTCVISRRAYVLPAGGAKATEYTGGCFWGICFEVNTARPIAPRRQINRIAEQRVFRPAAGPNARAQQLAGRDADCRPLPSFLTS